MKLRYRYLDNPVLLADGTVLRFPLVTVRQDGNVRWTARLYKRRRQCRDCGHRHGPQRNLPAKACPHRQHGVGGPETCGCTEMTDWLHPSLEHA